MQSAALTEAAVPHLYLPLCARSCLQVFAGAALSEPHFPPPPPAACPGQGLGPPRSPAPRQPAAASLGRMQRSHAWPWAGVHGRARSRVGLGAHVGACSPRYVRALSMGAHTRLRAHGCTYAHAPVRAYTCAYRCLRTLAHACTYTCMHLHTHTHADVHGPVSVHTCVHTCTLADTNVYTHPRTRHQLHVCSSKTRVCTHI